MEKITKKFARSDTQKKRLRQEVVFDDDTSDSSDEDQVLQTFAITCSR
jgi:hypothetical protein